MHLQEAIHKVALRMRGGQDEWLQGTGDRVLDLNTSYDESTFQWRPKVGMLLSRLATKILVSTAPSAVVLSEDTILSLIIIHDVWTDSQGS